MIFVRFAPGLLCALLCSSALAASDEYDCIAEARQVVEIRSPVEGLIEQVTVDRGDTVLEVKRAEELLNMRTLRNPFSGVVVQRVLKAGEFATSNVKEPILELAEVDPLNVEVVLPASL
jgi:multidrug resistance efflux pump